MNLRVALLLFTTGWGANHFSTLLVVYRKNLGLLPQALGILFGAYALGLVPGLVLAGRVSDRRGRRAVVLPASWLAIVASGVLAFGARGFGVLLAGRLLYGLATGSVMSPGSVWVQELSPSWAGARRATLALSAGFGAGPLVSGLIAEFAPAPMVWPYVLHAIAMAAACVAARPVPETAPGVRAGAASASSHRRGLGRREWAVLAQWLPVAPWAFGFPAVTIAILPGLMRTHVTRLAIYSGLVIATTLAAGVAVQPFTRRLARRGDLVGLGLGALGIFLAAHAVDAGSPAQAFAVAILVGAGYGLVMTTGLLEISQRVSKESRGAAVGIYYVMTYIGFALPFIHATVAAKLGDAPTLAIAGAATLGSVLVRAVIKSVLPPPALEARVE